MIKRTLLYSAGILVLGLLWTGLALVLGEEIVPFPWIAVNRLIILCSTPSVWLHLAITYVRTIVGFAFAFLAGTAIGIIAGRARVLEKTFFLPVSVLQGAPPLLWIIPLMLIFGTRGTAPVAIVFFVVVPLVIINVQEGVKSIDRESIDMFRVYARSRVLLVTELFIPGLGSHLRSIILTGFLLGLKSSILGEWFGAHDGIGRIINEYFYTFDMPSFYAVSLFYILSLGIAVFLLRAVTNALFDRRSSRIKAGPHTRSILSPRAHGSSLVMEKVFFSYGRKLILDGISFSLLNSGTVVLIGDSGAGKTTFAKLALGLLAPQKGSLTIPRNAYLIFQDDALLWHLDCFGNASLPARSKKLQDVSSRTLLALEQCGLADFVGYFPDELSGGMKKRLAFARALVADPDFIILDEPFNKLHREAREELWELYFSLFSERKIPSIIITHFPEELARFGDCSQLELVEGKLVTISKR
jgi:ABC-type nitrate/sulfonate/bicarbonate transport system ATPase subunit/ABC-type nitrate/sulfonate/bicarbonate transport system permease component